MKICIDAGHNHSGIDTGAEYSDLKEQDITYSVAKKLGDLLIPYGIEVVYTRNKDDTNLGTSVTESLSQRCYIANSNQCNLFISIHCNSGGGIGTETYVYKKSGESNKVANLIQYQIVQDLGMIDRKVKENSKLYVLKYTNMPAVLVELGFIDSAEDNQKLRYKQNLFANAIKKAILDYLGISEMKEYLTPSEAIGVLINKGIISDGTKWYNGTWEDDDFKWLLRKVGTYINEH